MTLEDAIQQLIELGEKDPLTIARKIQHRHGDDWLVEQLRAYAEDFVSDMARHRLTSLRRSAQKALALSPKANGMSRAELMIQAVFHPKFGWKPLGEITLEEAEMVASWYRKLQASIGVYADFWDDMVATMHREGATRIAQIKGALPLLGNPKELVAA